MIQPSQNRLRDTKGSKSNRGSRDNRGSSLTYQAKGRNQKSFKKERSISKSIKGKSTKQHSPDPTISSRKNTCRNVIQYMRKADHDIHNRLHEQKLGKQRDKAIEHALKQKYDLSLIL
jgi:hypothetical protein